MKVRYTDFKKQRNLVTTMSLVFYSIKYILSERAHWPDYQDTLWEVRDVEFKEED